MSRIRVAKGALYDRIYAGHVTEDMTWKSKDDVTSDVLRAVIDYIGPGNRVTVSEDGVVRWSITVEEVEP